MTTKNRKRTLSAFVALIGVLLMSSGFAVMATAGSASAHDKKDEECVETPGTDPSYTKWKFDGLITTHDSNPPGENTDTVKYVQVSTYKHVTQEYVPPTPGTEGHWEDLGWYNWTGGPRENAPGVNETGWHGPLPNPPQGAPHDPVPENVYNTSKNDQGLASWFKYDGTWVEGEPGDPGKPEESHTDYKWKKLVREYVPGKPPVVCPPDDKDPDLAEADVIPTDPTCEDPNGSFTTTMTNATISEGQASGDGVPGGSVSVTFAANEGAEFDDGTTSRMITVNFGELVAPEGFEIVDGQCVAVEPPTTCPDGSPVVEGVPCDEVVSPPGEEPPAAAPPVNNPPAKAPTPTKRATSAVAGPTTSTPSSTVAGPTIPSTVKAGLGEDVAELAATRTSQGLALVGAGALVMLAGGLGMVRRRGAVARI